MIQPATHHDLNQIISIYEQTKLDRKRLNDFFYQSKIQKKGFLLGLDSESSYKEQLTGAELFLVHKIQNKISGYIVADHREKFLDDEYKTWFDERLRNIYYNDLHATTLDKIAVSNNVLQKGIATELLQDLEKRLREKKFRYLFSIVTLAPITNCPSIIFHTKNRFKRIATGRPRRLFNLENYSSILFCKKII